VTSTSVTQEEATEIARKWLEDNGYPIERRIVTSSAEFRVVFSVPPDTLGGDFTLVIDAATGSIVDRQFER